MRWWVVIACVIVADLLATAYLLASPDKVSATAVLQVTPQSADVGKEEAQQPSSQVVQSHVNAVMTEPVLSATVGELNLINDPEFAGSSGRPQPSAKVASARDALARRLKVSGDGRSAIIKVEATADEGAAAARLANSVSQNYIRYQQERKASLLETQRSGLARQVSALGSEAVQAEKAAEEFRGRSGLVPVSEYDEERETYGISTPQMQELIETSRLQSTLDSRRIQAEVRHQSQQQAIAAGRGNSTREVLASPVVIKLRKQEDALLRERADLLARHSPSSPLVIRVDARLAEIRREIAAEIRRIHTSVAVAAQASRSATRNLRGDIHQLSDRRSRDVGVSSRFMALRRDARLKREAYERVAASLGRISVRAELQLPDVMLVSPAVPASMQNRRNWGGLLALATLAGLLAGLCLEALRKAMKHQAGLSPEARL